MSPDFNKNGNGLIPAIIQDSSSLQVLMQGYMNEDSFNKSIADNRVCFYSRSKNRLWTKGEESGNFLNIEKWALDCDNDSLLFLVKADGPTCHTGSTSCFGDLKSSSSLAFISELESTIENRRNNFEEQSYVSTLTKKGIAKVAQKVGEEAVEMVIEAMKEDQTDFLNESADLLFHYLILLQTKGYKLKDVAQVLKGRTKK